MKLVRAALPLTLITLAACSRGSYEQTIHDKLVKSAGANALDCGHATGTADYSTKTDCAMSALHNKRPFFVQYYIVGTDAGGEYGFVFDGKRVSSLSVFTWGTAAPVGKIDQSDCDIQKLKKTKPGYLICY